MAFFKSPVAFFLGCSKRPLEQYHDQVPSVESSDDERFKHFWDLEDADGYWTNYRTYREIRRPDIDRPVDQPHYDIDAGNYLMDNRTDNSNWYDRVEANLAYTTRHDEGIDIQSQDDGDFCNDYNPLTRKDSHDSYFDAPAISCISPYPSDLLSALPSPQESPIASCILHSIASLPPPPSPPPTSPEGFPYDPDHIPVNLEPPSPLLLASGPSNNYESFAGYEQKAIESLGLDTHEIIKDTFCTVRPLLDDPEVPIIPSPIYLTVDELLQQEYPFLGIESDMYQVHKERLIKNRDKMCRLALAIEEYELRRKRATYSKQVASEERARKDKEAKEAATNFVYHTYRRQYI